MTTRFVFLLSASVLLFSLLPSLGAGTWPEGAVSNLQHAGAVYFELEEGEFELSVYKRNLPSQNAVDRSLKMLLLGPDGRLYGENLLLSKREIIDEPGPLEEMTLSTSISKAGVYLLLMSSPNREGSSYEWGFSSNAKKYLISSVAGHPREDPDPIVLRREEGAPAAPFSLFFKTPPGSFNVIASHLSTSAELLEMYDGKGEQVRAWEVKKGKAEEGFTSPEQDVWELRLPSREGRIVIKGASRDWKPSGNAFPVWTTAREHYFDLGDFYWLLSPRRFARDVSVEKQGRIPVSVANSSDRPLSLRLALEGAEGADAVPSATVSPAEILLEPGKEHEVEILYDLPAEEKGNHAFHLVARDKETRRQSFSFIELRAGAQDRGQAVALPIEVELYGSQSQFAYEPDYPRASQLYFDSENRPWTVDSDGLKVLLDGQWKAVNLPGGKQAGDVYPGASRNRPEKTIGTDGVGYVYAIVKREKQPYLLRVRAGDEEAQLAPLPKGGEYMIEVNSGGGASTHPPALVHYTKTKQGQIAKWATLHQIELLIPEVSEGELRVSEPVLISDNCIGMAAHSGMPSPIASYGDEIYLIWGATSDPVKQDPGVPTYVATYHRETKVVSKALIAYSPPVNDVHNMSSLLVDREGGKHAIIGSHGKPFQYLYSAAGSDAWTEPEKLSEEEQTYVGATFNRQGGITVFFRVWERRDAPTHAIFAYQQRDARGKWGEIQPFAKGPLLSYGVYYHRVTVDRRGRLYVSFEYWTTWDNYRNSFREAEDSERLVKGWDRWLFRSEDGEKWSLVRGTTDLTDGLR